MPDKVEKEVALWNTDDFLADHNEQGEPLRAVQAQTLCDGIAEVL